MNKQAIFQQYPYRLELHAHTSPASPCSEIPPEDAVRRYHAKGFDGIAITNHFNLLVWEENHKKDDILARYYDDYLRAAAEGEKLGMKVYFGMEIRFAENANDYLVYGIDEKSLSRAYDTLGGGLEGFATTCRREGMFFAQAHPFRNGMERMNPEFMDGIEVYNMHFHHNSRIAMAEVFAVEHHLKIMGGTDFHHPNQEGSFCTRTKTLPNDSFELAALLHSQDFCFQLSEALILP